MSTALWHRLVKDRDEDLAPQLVSWAIALSAGAVWLAVVYMTPTIAKPVTPVVTEVPPQFHFTPGRSLDSRDDAGGGRKSVVGTATKHPLSAPQLAVDVAKAFAGTSIGRKVMSDVTGLIDHVEAVGAMTSTMLTGGKSTLTTGGARATPGRSKFGEGNVVSGQGIGAVTHAGGVQRAEVHVQALAVVVAPAPTGGTIDATEAGTFVRARAAELQYCYARTAGAAGSDLAGVVTLRLVLAATGAVRDAEIVRRTWSGPDAAEIEACLLATARRWRVPSASDGASLTLPISFTRGR